MKLFIDTNIFVSVLSKEKNYKKAKKVLEEIHEGKHLGITSTICIAEVLSGFYSKGEKENGDRYLADVRSINNFRIVGFDIEIAKEAAKMRAKFELKLPDAIIIATCKTHACTLVTRDRELIKIEEIEVIDLGEV